MSVEFPWFVLSFIIGKTSSVLEIYPLHYEELQIWFSISCENRIDKPLEKLEQSSINPLKENILPSYGFFLSFFRSLTVVVEKKETRSCFEELKMKVIS